MQAIRWMGIRVIWHPDHNHRDHNDLNTAGATLRLPIEVLGRCATGPFKTGLWHKALLDAANRLMEDEDMLAEYEKKMNN